MLWYKVYPHVYGERVKVDIKLFSRYVRFYAQAWHVYSFVLFGGKTVLSDSLSISVYLSFVKLSSHNESLIISICSTRSTIHTNHVFS